ncbi:MAG: hypothetical protein QM831_42830 [Kofleriaceae bacterium]
MKWLLALACAGCWRDPPAVPPVVQPPALTMAIATDRNVVVLKLAGNTLKVAKRYDVGAPVASVYWIGDAANNTLAATSYSDGSTLVVKMLVKHAFVEQAVPWPDVQEPPDSYPDDHDEYVEADPAQRDLRIRKCWYLSNNSDPEDGPECALATEASFWPKLEVLGVTGIERHRPPVPVKLPHVAKRPDHVIFDITDRAIACSDGVSDPREMASSVDKPVVETIVVNPPIARITTTWSGYIDTGIEYLLVEGCAKSERFTTAVPAPDGSIVLYGKDLAVVRNGAIVALLPNLEVGSLAFPPPP